MTGTTFASAQERAKSGGYSIEKSKKGYVGDYQGIEYEDDDLEALLDDMDALSEIGRSEHFTFEETEAGDQISFEIDGKTHAFLIETSAAETLAKAKETWLELQPKPAAAAPKASRRRRSAEPEAEEAPAATAAAEAAPVSGDVLPPIVSGTSPALIYTINALINALQSIRANLSEAAAETGAAAAPSKDRRGRRNGA